MAALADRQRQYRSDCRMRMTRALGGEAPESETGLSTLAKTLASSAFLRSRYRCLHRPSTSATGAVYRLEAEGRECRMLRRNLGAY